MPRIGPRVTVGLEGENNHEGQQQAEQGGHHAEQLGRHLSVKAVPGRGDEPPGEPDTEQGEAHDQGHDDHHQRAYRHRVDQ